MKLILAALGVATAGLATAQVSTINSTHLEPRFFNDVPGSNLTITNPWPTVTIDDANVSAPTGYANRHFWNLSNDGGNTSYLFQPTDYWTLRFNLKLTSVGTKNKEAGVMLMNSINGDHIFLVKMDNGGEVAAFGGAFPFYSFTIQYDDHYVLGTDVTMAVTYFKDPADNIDKIIYRYNNHFSPAQAVANLEGYLLPDTRIGGYLQVVNDPNNPNNEGRAEYTNIMISDADKVLPETMNVNLGRVTSGNVRSLFYTDGDVLRVCRFIVPNQNAAPVTVEVQGTSMYPSLSALTFHVNSRSATNGLFAQILDLYDYSTSSYSTVDTRTDTLNTTYAVRDLAATGNIARYLGPNQELKARFRVKQTGPSALSLWCSEFDEANFTVAP